MVAGIDKFKEYFAGFEDNYVIIGGTACDIFEEAAGQIPRATKDIDIILIVEALTSDFVRKFWSFIVSGDYSTRQRGNGKNEYYRFLKPQTDGFPLQIELFSRKPDILDISEASTLTPISVDEDLSSLSAILMNDEHYNFTIKHSSIIEGVRIANTESLINLKAKAFLDLSDRKSKGENIDGKNIRKHRNDIFRLATTLDGGTTFMLPEGLQDDLAQFCAVVSNSMPDGAIFKSAGLIGLNTEEVFERLCQAFQIKL